MASSKGSSQVAATPTGTPEDHTAVGSCVCTPHHGSVQRIHDSCFILLSPLTIEPFSGLLCSAHTWFAHARSAAVPAAPRSTRRIGKAIVLDDHAIIIFSSSIYPLHSSTHRLQSLCCASRPPDRPAGTSCRPSAVNSGSNALLFFNELL